MIINKNEQNLSNQILNQVFACPINFLNCFFGYKDAYKKIYSIIPIYFESSLLKITFVSINYIHTYIYVYEYIYSEKYILTLL